MTLVFFRRGTFYTIQVPDDTTQSQIEEHVKLNPGTTRVESMSGKVLWPVDKPVRNGD